MIALALVIGGAPRLERHGHPLTDAHEYGHAHAFDGSHVVLDDAVVEQSRSEPQDEPDGGLHTHLVAPSVVAMIGPASLAVAPQEPEQWRPEPYLSLRQLGATLPPHRPPIA
jgi:hypothetical protein